jgi:hypothetical protein
MEENGRNHGNPWSSRRTGVYQQVTLAGNNSVWILVQPSDAIRECMKNVLSSLNLNRRERDGNPMYLHVTLLLATVDNWGRYIEYLNTELKDIVSYFNIRYYPATLILVSYRIRRLALFASRQRKAKPKATMTFPSSKPNSCIGCCKKSTEHHLHSNLAWMLPRNSKTIAGVSIALKVSGP